mmetsp:Transcript_33901/g.91773  ORF Transcript_33901/g.91773 Transcript_33901/m.91773 type:complete len:625 (-) Transcript_33901:378-2252(-)
MDALRVKSVVALILVAWLPQLASAHIEDYCVEHARVRNTYEVTRDLGCGYAPQGMRRTMCSAALLLEEVLGGGQFHYNTSCRGIVHFDAVYFLATSLGYKRDIAYWLAAFSQGVDFAEFAMFDSCGNAMDQSWWTPPLKGLVRTLFTAGGSNMHFGLPFVGEQKAGRCKPLPEGGIDLDCPPLQQSEKATDHWPKKQSAAQDSGCTFHGDTHDDFQSVSQACPGLNVSVAGGVFYDGPLAAWKRWAFNQTDIICNGGYTTLGKDGNPTTGSACPAGGVQYLGAVSKKVESIFGIQVLPFQGFMELGEQLFDYDCIPSCACYQNCSDTQDNENYRMVNQKRITMTPEGSTFGLYLQESCAKGRACMPEGGSVPELIARLGVLMHYAVDRASHWYCTDAPGTGVMLQRAAGKDYEYDLVLYMADSCDLVTHADTHYWEQGMGMADAYLSPATVGALHKMHEFLAEFADAFRGSRPEWFDARIKPMDAMRAIGTRQRPGYLYDIVRHTQAADRVGSLMQALKDNGLPPVPGWERACDQSASPGLPAKALAAALARQFAAAPEDCGLRALLGTGQGAHQEAGERTAQVVRELDANGDGWLSLEEVKAWEQRASVEHAFAQCDTVIIQV